MTTISNIDYLKILDLSERAKQHALAIKDIEAALAEIVGVEKNDAGYFGHVSHCIFKDDPAGHLVRAMQIEVVTEKNNG